MDVSDWWDTGDMPPLQLQGILGVGGVGSYHFPPFPQGGGLCSFQDSESGKCFPSEREINELVNQKNNYAKRATKINHNHGS